MSNKTEFSVDDAYLTVMENALVNGVVKGDRTGTGTYSVFGGQMVFDLSDRKLPLLTTKQLFYKSLIHETLWFISGSTDIKYLAQNNIHIWDSWVTEGEPRYRALPSPRMKRRIATQWRKASKNLLSLKLMGRDSLEAEYRRLFNEEPVELLSGSIHNPVTGALEAGSIGPGAYGAMWRDIEDVRVIDPEERHLYEGKRFDIKETTLDGRKKLICRRHIDQLADMIKLLRQSPDSRRNLVVTFDNRMVDFCMLPPCHSFFQVWTRELTLDERVKWLSDKVMRETGTAHVARPPTSEEEKVAWVDAHKAPRRALSLQLYCRSQDIPVGTPFNIAQYGLLAHMLAHVCGYVAEKLIWVGGDTHVYLDQKEQALEQLTRDPYPNTARVELNPNCTEIDDFEFADIKVTGYDNFHPSIKYPVAV